MMPRLELSHPYSLTLKRKILHSFFRVSSDLCMSPLHSWPSNRRPSAVEAHHAVLKATAKS